MSVRTANLSSCAPDSPEKAPEYEDTPALFLIILKLTGFAGDPKITTTDVVDGVKWMSCGRLPAVCWEMTGAGTAFMKRTGISSGIRTEFTLDRI